MNQYSFNVNNEERNNILDQHKKLYDGYAVRQNEPTKEQSLYVQDFANDKAGITVNSKGEVSPYSNKIYMKESKNICSECGLYENVCECGKMEEDLDKETGKFPKHQSFDYIEEEDGNELENDMALAVDDITGDSDLGLAMMDTEMDEGLFDFFDDEYEDFNDYMNSDDESFHPLKNNKDEKDTAFSRMKRGYEPEDIDFKDIDDDIKESFISQKNQITEMFNRFKKYN
jgi:hypothetical protein